MHRTQKQNKKQSGLKALLVIYVDLLTCEVKNLVTPVASPH